MERIRKNVAGIDIGAQRVFTAVEGQPVVSHLTFTEDFLLLRDYLLKHKVETVAMEATGVYWVILYEILEEAGIDVWLVDGRQTKQLPGRKTDDRTGRKERRTINHTSGDRSRPLVFILIQLYLAVHNAQDLPFLLYRPVHDLLALFHDICGIGLVFQAGSIDLHIQESAHYGCADAKRADANV